MYHFILGLVAFFGSSDVISSVVATVYGVSPTMDAQFLYMVKFIGAYMLVFAITTALLAYKPIQYRKFVWVPISLFAIRIIERIFFFSLLSGAYGITFAQDLRVILPIGVLAIALYYFRPKD